MNQGKVAYSHLVRILALLAITIGVFAVLGAAAKPVRQARITWSTDHLEVFISPGDSTVQDITFTSTADLVDAHLEVVPELAPLVTVEPISFGYIPANVAQSVRLKVAVPSGSVIADYAGTFHLRLGNRTVPNTAKVIVHVWLRLNIDNQSISIGYPGSWLVRSEIENAGGPVTITSFVGQYKQGGILPKDAAEITISLRSQPDLPLAEMIERDLLGATLQSSSTTVVGGLPGTTVTYRDVFSDHLEYGNIVVYVPRGELVQVFHLSYNAPTADEIRFMNTFERLLALVTFNN